MTTTDDRPTYGALVNQVATLTAQHQARKFVVDDLRDALNLALEVSEKRQRLAERLFAEKEQIVKELEAALTKHDEARQLLDDLRGRLAARTAYGDEITRACAEAQNDAARLRAELRDAKAQLAEQARLAELRLEEVRAEVRAAAGPLPWWKRWLA